MALFQKMPQIGDTIQFYTLGQNKTTLVVGLGNVGSKYNGTRHNIGFEAIDAFAKNHDFPAWMEKKDLKCFITIQTLGDTRVIVIKPTTYMNLSGEAVQAVVHFYKISPDSILVTHDELDIPFGQIRIRMGGSAAGHNGLKSIIEYMGENFGRVRIGIGPKTPEQIDSADFVLAPFTKEEQSKLKDLTRETTAILTETIFGDQLNNETRSFLLA